jgi:hypothetical protein
MGRRARPPVFNVHNANTGNYTEIRQNLCFHKCVLDDNIESFPILDVRMYIEPATTGGKSPDLTHFAFLHVVTPITFCLMRNIMYSCSTCTSFRDKSGLAELKGIWIDIANHQSTFGGTDTNEGNLFSGHTIEFSDLFNIHGFKYLPQHTTPAACVDKARNYAKMQTAKKMSTMTGLSRPEILKRVNVTFPNIDAVAGSEMLVEFHDAMWKEFAHKSAMALCVQMDEYETACGQWQEAKEKSRKDDFSLDFSAEAQEGAEDEPVLQCPYICRLPTYINWENLELANALIDFSATPGVIRISRVSELAAMFPDDIKFERFPPVQWQIHVNMTLIKPQLTADASYAETMYENMNFAIPQNIILEMQMQKSQPNPVRKDLCSKMNPVCQQWMRSIHTGNELRRYVADSAKNRQRHNPLFDFRAQEIWDTHVGETLRTSKSVREKVQHIQRYFHTTGVPYCKTIATVDTGELGGANRRVASTFVIGELAGTNGYRTHRKQTCDKWADKARRMYAGSSNEMDNVGGALYNAHKHLNGIWSMYSVLVPTKPDNTYIILSILLGDIASSLSGWLGCIGMCSNKIGHVMWVCDFGGNLYQYESSKGGKIDIDSVARIYEKSMGVGIDWALTQYFKNNNPNNFTQPQSKKVPHPDINDIRGLSEQAFSYLLCSIVQQNGKVISQPTEIPAPCYATELGEYKDGNSGGVNIIDKINNATIRNTETMGGMVRQVVGSRDDSKKGFQECFTQAQCTGLHCLIVSANKIGPNYAAKQFAEVTYRVASGADLSTNNEAEDAPTARAASRMGAESKYTSGKKDPELVGCERVIFLDFMSLALAVADLQHHGLMSTIASGFELEVFKVAANTVLQLQDYLARDTNIARWNRMLAIIQTRSTAFGLFLHSIRAITAPGREGWSFESFVADTAFAWRCDPWPVECIPASIRMLIEQAFDWGYWLMLGVFCDYFKVPIVDSKTIQELFDDRDGSYEVEPNAQKIAVQKWLAGFGLCSLHTVRKNGSVIFAPERDSNVTLQSGVYLTSCMENDSVEGSDLSFLVKEEATGGANSSENSPAVLTRTVASIVSKFMIHHYGPKLAAWCNAKRRESLEIIIARYLNRPMGALCIGRADGGRGYESVDNILRAFDCPNAVNQCGIENSDIYIDGGAPRVQSLLNSSKLNYKVPSIVHVRHGGNLVRFGLEIRSLLLAQSLMEGNFTQTNVRMAFLRMTKNYIEARVPETIYPHARIYTNTPGMDSSVFAFKSLAVGTASNRPETLCRSLPIIPVQNMCANMLQGCCYGMLAEEGSIVQPYLRLVFEVSADSDEVSKQMQIFEFHLNCPPPGLPADMNVPVRISRDAENPQDFCWGMVLFQDNKYTLFVSATTTYSNSKVLAHASATEAGVRGNLDLTLNQNYVFETLDEIVGNDLGLFIDWTFLWARPGILVKIEILPGVFFYATMDKWDDAQWYSGDSFTYKLVSGLEADENEDSPVPLAIAELLRQYSADSSCPAARKLQAAVQETAEEEICMRMKIFEAHGFGVTCGTNDVLAQCFVPVGSFVHLDVSHSSLWDEFKDLLYLETDDKNTMVRVSERPCAGTVLVVTGMVLYELPDDVTRNCTNGGDIVWVGVKMVNMRKKPTSARFYAVPTQAICDLSFIDFLDLNPLHCVCVKPTQADACS